MISYEDRVRQLELEGCTTSDAQSVADCEVLDGKVAPSGDYDIHAAIVKRINAQRAGKIQIEPSPEAQAQAELYAKWKLSRDARLANRSAS
jgi:hypothetical protein